MATIARGLGVLCWMAAAGSGLMGLLALSESGSGGDIESGVAFMLLVAFGFVGLVLATIGTVAFLAAEASDRATRWAAAQQPQPYRHPSWDEPIRP